MSEKRKSGSAPSAAAVPFWRPQFARFFPKKIFTLAG
jgi:hypothetical protein